MLTCPPKPLESRAGRGGPCAMAIFLLSLTVFALGLQSEPHFVDESAIIAKSYYLDRWLGGRSDDPAWLDYPALDHPPLAQYLTGLGLRLGGHPFPGRGVIWAWYRHTSVRGETDAGLLAARWPSVVLGALGCVAIYSLGSMAGDRRVGVVAALLLIANPLYRLHARRAIGDAPCEALILGTLAVGLRGWRDRLAGRSTFRSSVFTALVCGVLGGLAVSAKLNGGIGLMTLAAWGVLGAALPQFSIRRKLAVGGMIAVAWTMAFLTFVGMNPLLTVHPRGTLSPAAAELARAGLWGRVGAILKHRIAVSDKGRQQFPADALWTPADRLAAVAVQGFGRFGPFGPRHSDSTRRLDWRQDWGALVWGPWVACGAVWAFARGRSQLRAGEPPTLWAVGTQVALTLAVVTAFIPLAWDRYYLDLQPGAALLGAVAAVVVAEKLLSRLGFRFGLGVSHPVCP